MHRLPLIMPLPIIENFLFPKKGLCSESLFLFSAGNKVSNTQLKSCLLLLKMNCSKSAWSVRANNMGEHSYTGIQRAQKIMIHRQLSHEYDILMSQREALFSYLSRSISQP